MRAPTFLGVDGVVRLEDGRRAYAGALPPHGMMAERTVVDPNALLELPEVSTP